jgi:hypothetical protein
MNGTLGVWLFLTVVSSAVIVVGFWYARARAQMRHELILKLLETGQTVDSTNLDKLLFPAAAPRPNPRKRPPDPRDPGRTAGFVFFLLAFFTLAFAFTRSAGVSYPHVALGLLPFGLAFRVWSLTEREFRDGTLARFTNGSDPRESYQSGGSLFFFIGYGTIFWAITRSAGISNPLIGLGLLPIVMAFLVWFEGDRQFRAGLLGNGVPHAPDIK